MASDGDIQDSWPFMGSATLLNKQSVLFTFHQYKDALEISSNPKLYIVINTNQTRDRDKRIEVVDCKPVKGYDLVVGTLDQHQSKRMGDWNLTLADTTVVQKNLKDSTSLYFCGWGSRIEGAVEDFPVKNDLVIQKSSETLPAHVYDKWDRGLRHRLEPDPAKNWLESHPCSITDGVGPNLDDSGGGLIMLADSKIYLVGIAIKGRKNEVDNKYYALYVSLDKIRDQILI